MPKRTHDNMTETKCWINYDATSDFPIENLPYGVFKPSANAEPRCGVAIGDQVLDLSVLAGAGFFSDTTALQNGACFSESVLNPFMELGRAAWTEARTIITDVLSGAIPGLRDDTKLQAKALVPQSAAIMCMPARIGDYTDFYASKNHATNVGCMFRNPATALNPNWTHLPVGYHGRASSVVLSGTDIIRPRGQKITDAKATYESVPIHAPCALLDFELEMGCFVGGPENPLGTPVPIAEAPDRLFGVVLLNDWSARDIQKWEYVPLGPFNGKNFATSISPWVVTFDALKPFGEPMEQSPTPLPYLRETEDGKTVTSYNIKLGVGMKTASMEDFHTISDSNFNNMSWTFAQMIAHHSSTGCNMRAGDLMGSGTISAADPSGYGSLLEICWKGTKPFTLPDGSVRRFAADGDSLRLTGYCQGDGYRVGFGSVDGTIKPCNPQ
jgi:fumarylacetoacetase